MRMNKTTIIIAGYQEENVIGRSIKALVTSAQKAGLDFQIIQVSPDEPTLSAGNQVATELGIIGRYKQIVDPLKGKAYALNQALEVSTGELIVMSDGDVFVDQEALKYLLEPFQDQDVGGATGRPLPTDTKTTFMGYLANLLTTVAHVKRTKVFTESVGSYLMGENAYFPLSGYLLAFRNNDLRYAPGYIDDTYISIQIFEKGKKLAYCPKAKVFVTYPKNLTDYFKQRRRNIEGNRELHKKFSTSVDDQRTLRKELEFILFPLMYAQSPKQYIWSLCLYPIRSIAWVLAFADRFKKKDRDRPWDPVRSTKA